MTILYFVRHGETKANVDGILTGTLETSLTKKGIAEAKKIGEQLTENFNAYYCSPLKRTHQTLHAMKGDVKFIVDKRLIEVTSGIWQGKLKSELPTDKYNLYKNGLLNPPGGENLIDVDKRIKSFLIDMFSKYKNNEKILIITHNAFMRSLKRLLINYEDIVEPKNLEMFLVDEKMYNEMLNNKN